jgi:hypothetical protein
VRELYLSGLLILAAAGSAGCSTRSVYEGIQQQEAVKNPSPAGQPEPRRPTYDEYETERRKAGAP